MDKLIPVINFLKTNRFWITCGILSVAMIATWFISTNSLLKEKKQAESDIDQKINSANAIIRTTAADVGDNVVAHPNDSTIAGMEVEIQEGVDAVLAAWELRRNKQEGLVQWPETLGQDFIDAFSIYSPMESYPVDKDPNDYLKYLQIYRQQIPGRMQEIAAIIGTKWKYADEETDEDGNAQEGDDEGDDRGDRGDRRGGRGGIGSGGAGLPGGDGAGDRGGRRGGRSGSITSNMEDDDISIVVRWNEENQDLWHDKMTKFRGFDDNQLAWNYPTPLQIFMLQQDLWTLEAVFGIIKEVNGDADANDLARIKQIDHIAFGREARAQLGELSKPNKALASKSESAPAQKGMKRGSANRQRRNRAKKETADPFATNTDKFKSPFHGRYVNGDFEPIAAEDVRNALDPELTDLPEKNIELIVAKRVPVRIAVRMDERYIPDFISRSANHPFAFEINQVRINRHVPGEGIVMVGALAGGARGGSSEESDRGNSIGAAGGAGGGAGLVDDDQPMAAEDDGEGPIETRTNYTVDVEFYGILKIYNPVNRALLTGEKPEKASTTP